MTDYKKWDKFASTVEDDANDAVVPSLGEAGGDSGGRGDNEQLTHALRLAITATEATMDTTPGLDPAVRWLAVDTFLQLGPSIIVAI